MTAKPFMLFTIATICLAACATSPEHSSQSRFWCGGGGAGGALVLLPLWIAMCATAHDGAPGEKAAAAKALAETIHAAAKQGDAEAQHELGTSYASGNGVSRDDVEAFRWYQKSADQGSGDAQLALAWIYSTGRGVASDDVQAPMWCLLAASAQGSTETTKRAIDYTEFLQKRMTPEQIVEARRRAQEWKPSTNATTVSNGASP